MFEASQGYKPQLPEHVMGGIEQRPDVAATGFLPDGHTLFHRNADYLQNPFAMFAQHQAVQSGQAAGSGSAETSSLITDCLAHEQLLYQGMIRSMQDRADWERLGREEQLKLLRKMSPGSDCFVPIDTNT